MFTTYSDHQKYSLNIIMFFGEIFATSVINMLQRSSPESIYLYNNFLLNFLGLVAIITIRLFMIFCFCTANEATWMYYDEEGKKIQKKRTKKNAWGMCELIPRYKIVMMLEKGFLN